MTELHLVASSSCLCLFCNLSLPLVTLHLCRAPAQRIAERGEVLLAAGIGAVLALAHALSFEDVVRGLRPVG